MFKLLISCWALMIDILQHADTSLASATKCSDFPTLSAPEHAYPATYPPSCDYDPFPTQPDVRSFSTPWPRKPSLNSIRHDSIDVLQLTSMFEGLKIGSPADDIHDPVQASHLPSAIGFHIIPPLAPLPCLVRAQNLAPRHRFGSRKNSTAHHSTNVLSGFDIPKEPACTGAPHRSARSCQAKPPTSRRKTAPFPRRVPKGKSNSWTSPGSDSSPNTTIPRQSPDSVLQHGAAVLSSRDWTSSSSVFGGFRHPQPPSTAASSDDGSRQEQSSPQRVKHTESAASCVMPQEVAGTDNFRSPSASSVSSSDSFSSMDSPLTTPPVYLSSLPETSPALSLYSTDVIKAPIFLPSGDCFSDFPDWEYNQTPVSAIDLLSGSCISTASHS